jgi:hypothetical protein
MGCLRSCWLPVRLVLLAGQRLRLQVLQTLQGLQGMRLAALEAAALCLAL